MALASTYQKAIGKAVHPQWGITAKDIGRFPPRVALGSTMLYHGLGKLKPGAPRASAPFFESLGFHPGKRWAVATGLTEAIGGICLLLGIATRPAALGILATQAVAVSRVHKPKGFDSTRGGYEWNLALMGIALANLIAGPGKASAHWVMERRLKQKNALRKAITGCQPWSVRLLDAVG